jgi:hypothetical protein
MWPPYLKRKGEIMQKYDPWQEVANSIGGIVKFAKGRWAVDNNEVETGENGMRLCPLVDTALHGAVKWVNERIIDRRVQPYARTAPSNQQLELGRVDEFDQAQACGRRRLI